MTAKILALPNAAVEPVVPRFDPETASDAEIQIWMDGRQSVIDDLLPVMPVLRKIAAQHGVALAPRLSAVS